MRTSKPIFVVGSPRSGTSILTWCLGQHSNIFVQEESNWMGHLAFQLEIAYRVGTARGERSQLSALGVQHRDFFATFGQTINDLILDHRERLETRIAGDHSAKKATQDTGPSAFQISRTVSDPKTRWVDGTPEYSFYINPLRKLFPAARFVHVVRDVVSVVRSMMNFQRTGGPALVEREAQAYDYWLRTVTACFQAERAYGPEIVCRIRHQDLLDRAQPTIEMLLTFLGEDFEPSCLQPLRERINSSRVSDEFDPSDPSTDPALVEAAQRLNANLIEDPPPRAPDPVVADEMERAFQERLQHLWNLEGDNRKAAQHIAEVEKRLAELRPAADT